MQESSRESRPASPQHTDTTRHTPNLPWLHPADPTMQEKYENSGEMSCLEWCSYDVLEPVLPQCLGGYDASGRVHPAGYALGQGVDCTTVMGEGNGAITCFCAP